MTRHYHLRLAGSAIAAALALGTTPTFAQDAEAPGSPPITIVVPQPAPAPVPVPAAPAAQIESPAISTAQADLRAATASPQPAERTAARSRTPVAARAATAAMSPPIARADLTASQFVADAAPASTLPPAIEAAPIAGTDAVATNDADLGDEALFGAGLLAALGLGGLALAFTRRRRTRRVDAYRETAPVVRAPPAAAIEPTPPPIAHRVAPQQWTSPTAFAMPAIVPEDESARRELIERMVAAKPDAANPFKARKTRTRRARQILSDRIANQRPVLEDRVVARPATPVGANQHREFEKA